MWKLKLIVLSFSHSHETTCIMSLVRLILLALLCSFFFHSLTFCSFISCYMDQCSSIVPAGIYGNFSTWSNLNIWCDKTRTELWSCNYLAAKVHYGTSLANVDWLHGGAESLLTVTNLLIVLGLREGLRKIKDVKKDKPLTGSETKERSSV